MTGLLRKYKISKISDIKLSDQEYFLCQSLDNLLSGLTKCRHNNITYFVNSENIWLFDDCGGTLCYINKHLLQPIFEDVGITLFPTMQTIILDWIEDLYDIRYERITWSLVLSELEAIDVRG